MDNHEMEEPTTPKEPPIVTTSFDDASTKAATQTTNPPDASKTSGSKTAAVPDARIGVPVQPDATATGESSTGKEARARQKKVAYRKKSKEQRKNLKGWIKRKCEEIFLPLVLVYADLLSQGVWQELEQKMSEWEHLYHHHFPYPMRDHEEPDVLTPFNLHDTPVDNDEGLSDEQLTAKCEHVNGTNVRLRRWLQYRAKKLKKRAMKLSKNVGVDAYAELALDLAGLSKCPRQPHAVNVWARENKKAVNTAISTAGDKRPNKEADDTLSINFRDKVKRDLFNTMPPDV
ncbi:hypothetical protein BDZ89DRAFT_1147501 [Hymenopellis radicata]|nr:hypothetical protein BDZ89DRAFT_1147501 [Hymenopellis radicata]